MKNIILIGMPSAGKSTVGVILAKHRGMSFVDTDVLIQSRQGRLLQEIINSDGTEAFLKIEESEIKALDYSDTVIATGGSVVYSDRAMGHLKKTGIVIYLYVDMDTVNKRLKNLKTRGVVLGPGQSLEDIYRKRQPLYEKYADIIIDCSEGTIDSTVEMIHEKLDSLS